MATQLDKLVPDASQLNFYGESPESASGYSDATKQALDALEQRYSQPNWFKVSAGFLKPQLGGFGASLGSAFEALGENVEQQKALQIPIAQARAQLAVFENQMGHKKTAAKAIEDFKKDHPNDPLPPELINFVTLHDRDRGEALNRELQTNVDLFDKRRLNLDAQFKAGNLDPAQYKNALKDLNDQTQILNTSHGKDVSASNPVTNPGSGTTTNNNGAPVTQTTESGGTQQAPKERVVLKTPGSEFTPVNPPEETKAGNTRLYENLDKQGASYLDDLSALGSPKIHSNNMKPIKELLKYSDDPRFNTVMGILSGQGFMSGLGALIENGLHGSIGDYNASLSVALSKIALASKDPNVQSFAQNVYRTLAQIELNNQRSVGLNPSSARNAEFSILSSATAHSDTLPDAAKLFALQAQYIQLRNRDLYNDTRDLLTGNHKSYVIDPNSPTKLYLTANSPSQQKIIDAYEKKIEEEVDRYIRETGGGKP